MNAAEYQRRTAEFAVYPKDRSLEYLTLGLAGEAGEVANKVKKILRGDVVDPETLLSELGDVAWYLSEFGTLVGYSIAARLATGLVHNRCPDGLPLASIDLCEAVGSVCASAAFVRGIPNAIGWRDELDEVLDTLYACAAALGFTLEQVFAANIAKLESRRTRGVIQGSGDNR